ncbi:MAG: cytochrome c biogenesis protein CcdA, partial [Syntrophobacteraceae bacterium]
MSGMETYIAGSPLLAIGAAFAGGVLASLAPCVYPMIPIISAYVSSKTVGEPTRAKSFLLSVGYVVGMATVYSLLGMIAALTGSFFGKISTNPWALLIV